MHCRPLALSLDLQNVNTMPTGIWRLASNKFIAKQEDIVKLITSMETEISNNNTTIMSALDEVKEHVDVAAQHERVRDYHEVVDGVIHYFKVQATNLQNLTPKNAAFSFQTFVNANGSTTALTEWRDDSQNQQGALEGMLNSMLTGAKILFDWRVVGSSCLDNLMALDVRQVYFTSPRIPGKNLHCRQ